LREQCEHGLNHGQGVSDGGRHFGVCVVIPYSIAGCATITIHGQTSNEAMKIFLILLQLIEGIIRAMLQS
jgi:hypothetical protein